MAKKLKNKTACNRSFVQFLFHTCFTYSDISFLVFLTFWIYSDAITDFQVLGQQFSFCKKILCVFRSSSSVSSLGLIEKVYTLEKDLQPLCLALVCYYKKIKQKSGLHPLNQVMGCSRTALCTVSPLQQWPS